LTFDQLAAPEGQTGNLPIKPWSDSYWPYYKKDVAWRYISAQTFDAVDDQVDDAKDHQDDPTLSPAEKYDLIADDDFALTRNAWDAFEKYHDQFGGRLDQWDWMGICNGWSPASLALPTPKAAVVTKPDGGKPVIFFPGDLRALASKSYDLNQTTHGTDMIGSRCSEASAAVTRDRDGRPVDGVLTATGESFYILQDLSLTAGALEVATDPVAPSPFWVAAPGPMAELDGDLEVYIYGDRDTLAADLTAHTLGAHARGDKTHIELYKACRDVNPASVHAALVQLMAGTAPAKGSFVVQLSRFKQVWNYPLWGFTSVLGAPWPVASEPPAKRAFRSPAAVWIQPVTSRLVYASEVDPAVDYPDDDKAPLDWAAARAGSDRYHLFDLKYTLEIDAAGYVVGGEWDESASGDINAIDFFWRETGDVTDHSVGGGPSVLKFSLVKKLLACSQQNPDGTVEIDDSTGHHWEVASVTCGL
jgi:hypothetical protein